MPAMKGQASFSVIQCLYFFILVDKFAKLWRYIAESFKDHKESDISCNTLDTFNFHFAMKFIQPYLLKQNKTGLLFCTEFIT